MGHYGWFILATLLFAFAGSFSAGYLKKKGKNPATHEDLNNLVEQVEATTRATRAIESRISSEVWDRQRQWELKREAVLGAIEALSAAEDTLMTACAFHQMLLKKRTSLAKEQYDKAMLDWKDKMTVFESKRTIATLMCGDELNTSLITVRNAIRTGMKWLMTRSVKSSDEIGALVSPAMHAAVIGARRELGLPEEVNPQSNGHLPTPGPDLRGHVNGKRAPHPGRRAAQRRG
jgi:hypothetical protein